MTKRLRALSAGMSCLLITLCVASGAQPAKKTPTPAARRVTTPSARVPTPSGTPGVLTLPPETRAAMEAAAQANAPGPVHRELTQLAGDYTTTTRLIIPTRGEPVESSGQARLTSVLQGRFLLEEDSGAMMGDSYTGWRLYGYNNGTKQYEGIWTWTLSTSMMTMAGTSPDGGKTINWEASYGAPGGRRQVLKVVQRRIDADRFVISISGTGPGATTTETTYTRKKKKS